ncbi:MAG: Rrf2 family transcriptional regulator [Candidatus Omnitrophica bacterium]|nr:Rrf2 family transcriptional regulator [Candidatus Omnitrophota bacterium]
MRISSRCDYACRAILELSLQWGKKDSLQIQEISDSQAIPKKYLVQILIQLKRAGFIKSIRGKKGGYVLNTSPQNISLGEVIRVVSGELLPVAESVSKKTSVFSGIWKEVEGAITKVVDSVSFEDIASRIKDKEKIIMYQI